MCRSSVLLSAQVALRRLRGLEPSWTEFADAAARLFDCEEQYDPAKVPSPAQQQQLPDALSCAGSGGSIHAFREAGRRLVADAAAAWRSAGEAA
jgi:hypothetical protein